MSRAGHLLAALAGLVSRVAARTHLTDLRPTTERKRKGKPSFRDRLLSSPKAVSLPDPMRLHPIMRYGSGVPPRMASKRKMNRYIIGCRNRVIHDYFTSSRRTK